MQNRSKTKTALSATAMLASSIVLVGGFCTVGTATAATAIAPPGCIQSDGCPTATASPSSVPTPSTAPTDGNNNDGSIGTAPPVSPTETDLADMPTDPASATTTPDVGNVQNGADPDGVYCTDAGGHYEAESLGGSYFAGVTPRIEDNNSTSLTGTAKWIASVTGTVGVSVSGSLKVSESALIEGVEATFGITLNASLSTTLGNEYDTPVPPHSVYDGQYGVWRRRSVGLSYIQYSNCTIAGKNTIVSYIPYAVGWYIWKA
jgi:hypothetical protein